ncbi:hypothetical protein [Actibacterium lipolyticum]|uniref:Transcriptional regulator n=1 Tax=Actibacterium lipolyticum TaxID=1524263 RepID=A0A238KJE2_9RHOB|nr:hypothetical protein [Actibacterium lipolyticum]SMX42891.1 hypothetical protein COL8621_02118 [Actibacterium lipolyticum]
MRILGAILGLGLSALALAGPAQADMRLLMVEQKGCAYCIMWENEIGPIYPKTAEGKTAPLRKADLRALPDDIELRSKPRFTPTFVLLRDGVEVSRIEGYPGEDFFWGLLGRMLETQTETTAQNLSRTEG